MNADVQCNELLLAFYIGIGQLNPVAKDRSSIIHSSSNDTTMMKSAQETRSSKFDRLEVLGSIASGIAHEISTPIQFVGDNLQFINNSLSELDRLLQSYGRLYEAALATDTLKQELSGVSIAIDKADVEFLRKELPTAIEQSLLGIQQVARIVSAIRFFAHPGTAKKELADINQSIELTSVICRHKWKDVADLELVLDPALPKIACHVNALSQVWLNLIVNAAHAVSDRPDFARGLIRIITKERYGSAKIVIADNGTGIPPTIRKRIFDPFFSTKNPDEGSGQGLSICKQIIFEHNGDVEFWSEIGKGSLFVVHLPIKCEPIAAAPRLEAKL